MTGESLVNEPPRNINPPTNQSAIQDDDPSLKSTWSHRMWAANGIIAVLICLAKSFAASVDSHVWIELILGGFIGYLFADLVTGVYHWGVDNYGSASTPIFGSYIEAFQLHHKSPWKITRHDFAYNLNAPARVITFILLPIDLICHDPALLGFVGVAGGCIMFTLQFHAWVHGTKTKLPLIVVALQDSGVLVSMSRHKAHHQAPYNRNYCMVSGIWDELLDKHKVFEALEMVLFFKFGLTPRTWSEPNSDWTQEADTPPIQLP